MAIVAYLNQKEGLNHHAKEHICNHFANRRQQLGSSSRVFVSSISNVLNCNLKFKMMNTVQQPTIDRRHIVIKLPGTKSS